MSKQRWLPLDGQEPLGALWERFPLEARSQVIVLYARLIVGAARGAGDAKRKEPGREAPHR